MSSGHLEEVVSSHWEELRKAGRRSSKRLLDVPAVKQEVQERHVIVMLGA